MKLRFKTNLTSEQYINQKDWRNASLASCPLHPHGGCSLARHGTYERVEPPGATARESVRLIFRTSPPRFKKLTPLRSRQGLGLLAGEKPVFLLGKTSTESGICRDYVAQKVFHGAIKHHSSVFRYLNDFGEKGVYASYTLTDFDAQELQKRVDAYVQQVQRAMREHSQADPKSANMGTTWTCAYLVPPHAVIAHIGDSRAYLHRGKGLHRITPDETMAQRFIDSGVSPDSVKNLGHILINSFCAQFESVSAQVHLVELESGDRLLLCSDGLTDMVLEERIEFKLRQHSKTQKVRDELVAQALENRGKDNVTGNYPGH